MGQSKKPLLDCLTQEQAAEIIEAIEYRLENDSDFYLTVSKEELLKSIVGTLRSAYFNEGGGEIVL